MTITNIKPKNTERHPYSRNWLRIFPLWLFATEANNGIVKARFALCAIASVKSVRVSKIARDIKNPGSKKYAQHFWKRYSWWSNWLNLWKWIRFVRNTLAVSSVSENSLTLHRISNRYIHFFWKFLEHLWYFILGMRILLRLLWLRWFS